MDTGKDKRLMTPMEWAVMHVLWDYGRSGVTAPEVRDRLEHKRIWHYSTIKTTMQRLAGKGFLRSHRLRKLLIWEPIMTEKKAKRESMKRLVSRAFEGDANEALDYLRRIRVGK